MSNHYAILKKTNLQSGKAELTEKESEMAVTRDWGMEKWGMWIKGYKLLVIS